MFVQTIDNRFESGLLSVRNMYIYNALIYLIGYLSLYRKMFLFTKYKTLFFQKNWNYIFSLGAKSAPDVVHRDYRGASVTKQSGWRHPKKNCSRGLWGRRGLQLWRGRFGCLAMFTVNWCVAIRLLRDLLNTPDYRHKGKILCTLSALNPLPIYLIGMCIWYPFIVKNYGRNMQVIKLKMFLSLVD